jgi:MATE family multidrug resistance protein
MQTPQSLGHHARRTLLLAMPVMLARAGLVLMLAVDTMLVGHAGGHQLAFFAISIAPQLIMVTIGTGLLLGTVVMTAQADGAGRLDECGRIWRLALLIGAALGVLFGLLQWQGEWLLRQIGESEDIAAAGGRVLAVWAFSMPALLLYMATTSFLEGITRPRAAMLVSLSANVVNFALAWGLVFGHAGLPAMGAVGAALATTITRWLMFLALAGHALTMQDGARFGIRKPLGGYYHLAGHLLFLGLPVALSVAFESTAFSGATFIAGWMGETPLAAYQLSINVTSFFYMLTLGLATAAAVRVGNAVGRGSQKDVMRAGWVAVGLVILLMLVIGGVLRMARGSIAGLYTSNEAVGIAALPALAAISFLVVFDGIQGVLTGALRGLADVRWPMASAAISFWGVALPLCYYIGYRQAMGPEGLIWSLTASLVVASLLLGSRFAIVARRSASVYGRG